VCDDETWVAVDRARDPMSAERVRLVRDDRPKRRPRTGARAYRGAVAAYRARRPAAAGTAFFETVEHVDVAQQYPTWPMRIQRVTGEIQLDRTVTDAR
jgi:hypothetical protein